MRALNFIENNRPGDARSDANRRAVRSWAARDPMLKTGERSKRRRKRYKPPSIVFIDDRAIEALQGTTLPPGVAQEQDQSTSDSANHSASPAQRPPQHIHPFPPDHHANLNQPPSARKSSLPGAEQIFPNQNYYPQRTNTLPPYPSVPHLDPPFGQAHPGQAEPSSFAPPPRNRPVTIYRNFGPPLETERSNPGPTNFQPTGYPTQYLNGTYPGAGPHLARPLSNPISYAPRQGSVYSESPVDYPRTNSIASSSTYASRQDEINSSLFADHQQRTNSLPNPSKGSSAEYRPVHQPSGSVSLPPVDCPPFAKRQPIQLPPLLPESRVNILGTSYSDSPVSALPRDTSFAAFASHYRYPTLTQQTTPPMVEPATPAPDQTSLRDGTTPIRRISTQSTSAPPPFVSSLTGNEIDNSVSDAAQSDVAHTPESLSQIQKAQSPISVNDIQAGPIGVQIPNHHGTLSHLPPEIRAKIYSHLLVSSTPSNATYGPDSGISTAILSTCRAVYCEAVDILYTNQHLITLNTGRSTPDPSSPNGAAQGSAPAIPPLRAISRMRSLTLSITFNTVNRGDCETSIQNPNHLVTLTEPIALSLLHSTALTRLTILLLNNTQRKTGLNRFRLQAVSYEMKRILFPFAYLKKRVEVEVAGFDTLDFAEAFAEMRGEFAGREPPTAKLLDDALMES